MFYLCNLENFNVCFFNVCFFSVILNIFRVGDYVSKSVSDDYGGCYMDMSNGIEDIFEIGDNELFIFVVVMNEFYFILGIMMFGCI